MTSLNSDNDLEETEREKRFVAVEIVQKKFSAGLSSLCNPRFLSKRYDEFLRRDDPIYVELLRGMQDEALSKTFVSYWTIAQTLATKSRFWLEDAVAEIIFSQAKRFGRPATHVYTQAMLGQGYFDGMRGIADIGEDELEHLTQRSHWRPPMKEQLLVEVDLLVGEQERERAETEQRPTSVSQHDWDKLKNDRAVERDRGHLRRIANAVGGRSIADVAIQCNLLVIEPERKDGKPHVHAFRFINPKTISSHSQRKQERVNLLRLYGFLVQEKIFRNPEAIQVSVAELLPRAASDFDQYDHYPDYFSSHTYCSSEKLWEFIGVPFTVVSQAIQSVAKTFRDQLHDGLRFLLPGSNPPPGWGDEQKR